MSRPSTPCLRNEERRMRMLMAALLIMMAVTACGPKGSPVGPTTVSHDEHVEPPTIVPATAPASEDASATAGRTPR
jgi:hypothetical protein